jgi:hypothetical protein
MNASILVQRETSFRPLRPVRALDLGRFGQRIERNAAVFAMRPKPRTNPVLDRSSEGLATSQPWLTDQLELIPGTPAFESATTKLPTMANTAAMRKLSKRRKIPHCTFCNIFSPQCPAAQLLCPPG